jgi:hypothetical protein
LLVAVYDVCSCAAFLLVFLYTLQFVMMDKHEPSRIALQTCGLKFLLCDFHVGQAMQKYFIEVQGIRRSGSVGVLILCYKLLQRFDDVDRLRTGFTTFKTSIIDQIEGLSNEQQTGVKQYFENEWMVSEWETAWNDVGRADLAAAGIDPLIGVTTTNALERQWEEAMKIISGNKILKRFDSLISRAFGKGPYGDTLGDNFMQSIALRTRDHDDPGYKPRVPSDVTRSHMQANMIQLLDGVVKPIAAGASCISLRLICVILQIDCARAVHCREDLLRSKGVGSVVGAEGPGG